MTIAHCSLVSGRPTFLFWEFTISSLSSWVATGQGTKPVGIVAAVSPPPGKLLRRWGHRRYNCPSTMGTSSLQLPFDDEDRPATLARSACGRGVVATAVRSTAETRRALVADIIAGVSTLTERALTKRRNYPLRPTQTNELIKRKSADCRAFFVPESLEIGIRIALPRTWRFMRPATH